MQISEYIGETTDYDKKQALEEKKPKSWCKSISAFANGEGGTLIFGVADDGSVIGLVNPQLDAEKISEIIKTHIEPIPNFNLRFQKINDKTLIILDIVKGEDTPYYYSADGVCEAYVRVGNESVRATATEQKRLVMRGKNSTFDTQLSGYRVKDFAFTTLHALYKRWYGKSFQDRDMISFGLANHDGALTNAGALLADDSPIICSRVFCTRWNGLDKSGGTIDALDSAEYSGSLIMLVENGEAFIQRNVRKMWRKTSTSREEMPEYAERSYHEALINALVHRDYLVSGSEVHIDIFDDRMEIYSPGGMPDGSNIQDRDPLQVPSVRRNPVIADLFARLGLMERKGSGFAKIIAAYEHQSNYLVQKRPVFRSDRYQFTVILPNLNYDPEEFNSFSISETNQGRTETNQAQYETNQAQLETNQGQYETNQAQLETNQGQYKTNQGLPNTIQARKETNQAARTCNMIIDCIRQNPTLTQSQLSKELVLPAGTVKYYMAQMKNQGIISREGSSQKGRWVFQESENCFS